MIMEKKLEFSADYFKTEVRDGFEVPSMMKRAWAAQMEVLHVVADVCNKNEIRYFADFGTLLGAVRHKGMIPWDDDIDICVVREEYNRLIEILPYQLPYGFVVAGMYADSERLQEAAFVPHLRVIADETLWNFNDYMRYFHGFPYQRVGIDIFPIDYISRDDGFVDIQKNIVRLGIILLRDWDELIEQKMLDAYLEEFSKLCNVNFDKQTNIKNYIWRVIDKISSICDRNESDYCTNFAIWLKNERCWFPKECYNTFIRIPFENFSVNAPKMYDEVLKAEFGENYMTPIMGGAGHDYPFYGHMEPELLKQIRNVGFKGSVDEFCEEVASGRLRV
jgi:lipopolysaccharide cholinephosphotransferase